MAAPYRVAYRDGRTQAVTADGYSVQGNFVIFSFNGNTVLTVAADLVEHIGESGVPEPE